MLGYYQNEAETDKVVYEENGRRWLRTQDLATMSTDGTIHLTGRIKRIYHKLSPEKVDVRVYPMRIEDTLTEHELVKQCAVVGVEDDVLAYRSVAYIIPSASVVDENEAMQQLKAHQKNLLLLVRLEEFFLQAVESQFYIMFTLLVKFEEI
jgi:acyl-CoA synthetase (AMP-forming)/AMP-acid ligase II